MKNTFIEVEIVVHPRHGMQLSEGYIRQDAATGFLGCIPGLRPTNGATPEEVLERLDRQAKDYFGDDVVVELATQPY